MLRLLTILILVSATLAPTPVEPPKPLVQGLHVIFAKNVDTSKNASLACGLLVEQKTMICFPLAELLQKLQSQQELDHSY